jgi:hypothetical protein
LAAYEKRFVAMRKPALFRDILMRHLKTGDPNMAPFEVASFMSACYEFEEEMRKGAPPVTGEPKLEFGRKPQR